MLTKADFQAAIRDSIANYPAVQPLYQVGDPRITQHLDAIASMLAMLSAQMEVAKSEPFDKVRDATVLADAAMRGIVRKSSPARVRVLARNSGDTAFLIESGRTLLDSSGLPYRIVTSATVPASGTATIEALQVRTVTVTHTVVDSRPFYSLDVPASTDDDTLCGILVNDSDGEYAYRTRYANVAVNDRVYHVEVNDQQQVQVRFGSADVVGTQPRNGDVITLSVSYSAGKVNQDYQSPFAFSYLASPAESLIDLRMDALLLAGENPVSMSVLRDLARYPSVYAGQAVYLGDFDFLVRRNFPSLQFVSVWNEAAEERVRGASAENINVLFVACLSAIGDETVLSEPNPATQVAPLFISDNALTATQEDIKALMMSADDGYRVRFVTPVRSTIAITIVATIATSYVASDVRQKIIDVLLEEWGETSNAARRGRNRPLYKRVYRLLRDSIPELSDDGYSDMSVNIVDPDTTATRPEMWRFVTTSSLSVTVYSDNIQSSSWH